MKQKRKDKKFSINNRARNLVRGGMSLLRAGSELRAGSDPKNLNKKWVMEVEGIRKIHQALNFSKLESDVDGYVKFEKWVIGQFPGKKIPCMSMGSDLTLIGILPKKIISFTLEDELELSCKRILDNKDNIFLLIDKIESINSCINNFKWKDGLILTQKLNAEFGYSMWGIETEVALMQISEGQESTKKLTDKFLRSTAGITRLICYYIRSRNETSQNYNRFLAALTKRMEKIGLDNDVTSYIKYKTLRDIDGCEKVILSIEKNNPLLDNLFTTVDILIRILIDKDKYSDSLRDFCREKVGLLSEIMERIGYKQYSYAPIPFQQESAKNFAINIIENTLFPVEKNSEADISSINEAIFKGIISKISTRDSGLNYESLAKLRLNFGWIPEFLYLGNINEIKSSAHIFQEVVSGYAPKEIGGYHTIEDLIKSGINDWIENTKFTDRSSIYKLIMGSAEEEEIFEIVREFGKEKNDIGDVILTIAANKLYECENINSALIVSNTAGISSLDIISVLPLSKIFLGRKWPSVKIISSACEIAIGLDLLLKVVDDRKIRTFKRYALEEMIKSLNCADISECPDRLIADKYDLEKIEYLFYSVCDWQTIELLPGMGGSRLSKEAREKILNSIAKIDSKNSTKYYAEAKEVEGELSIDDGLEIIDDSKVYVDEISISNIVSREILAEFERYKELVASGIGKADSILEAVEKTINSEDSIFQIPKNEADDLLAEMIQSIMDCFLFDPVFGLDIIIGRRIRHGTISGELRGYLEGEGLIGQRPSTGAKYEAPPLIEEILGKGDPVKRGRAISAFSIFSESIDRLAFHLRDQVFNVKSEKNPRGVFELALNAPSILLIRSIAQQCNTVEQFVAECIGIFWTLLSLRCERNRLDVEIEIKRSVNSIFQKLNEQLKSQSIDDPSILRGIISAQESLLIRASTISNWIRIPQIKFENQTYPLEHAINTTVAFIRGQNPSFSPLINLENPDDIYFDIHGFTLVHDALYIALKNVSQHSGIKDSVQVNIRVDLNFDKTSINFKIENDIAKSAMSSDKITSLENVRKDIDRNLYRERARKNMASGLSKLASIVHQNANGNLNFNINGNKFNLEFNLMWIKF